MKMGQNWIFIMANGGHIGFGHSYLSAMMPVKHLGDISCLGTHKPSSNDKSSQHQFANRFYGRYRTTSEHWIYFHFEPPASYKYT